MANKEKYSKASKEAKTEEKDERKSTNRQNGGKRRSDKKTNSLKTDKKSVAASSALLNAAGNISFPVAAGNSVPIITEQIDGIYFSGPTSHRIPGIMRLGFIATFGRMQSWTDAANVWIRKVYTYIRHQNAGHANYDAAALGMYLLAYRSALDYLRWMIRLYGVVMGSYVPMNKYTPRALTKSMLADYDSLIADLAKLRYYIVSYASRLNQMKVPNFKFYQQSEYLLNNVFADSDTIKCSMYIFDPDGYWLYKVGEDASETGMFLKPTSDAMLHNWTFGTIRNFGEEILNPILNSEDFNIMSGDIMKAYGDFCPVPVVPEDHTVYPIYDPNLLWSVHNARPVCTNREQFSAVAEEWTIKQDVTVNTDHSGAMVASFKIHMPEYAEEDVVQRWLGHMLMNTQSALIDAPMDNPDPSTIAAITEFITIFDHEFSLVDTRTVTLSSIEVLDAPDARNTRSFDYHSVGVISGFDMHPYVFDVTAEQTPSGGYRVAMSDAGPMGEVTNISTLYPDVKRRIDEAVVLDMFAE